MYPLVSIVVPVYNVEKFLDICIPSIIKQDYTNIEIILVIDGATDGSLQKCLYYKEQDSRILVIKKENGGVSSARNLGIDEAHGEYLAFVDADDYVEPNYISALVHKLNEYPDSVIKCGLKHDDESGKTLIETEFGNEGLHLCDSSLDISNKYDFATVYGKLFAMRYLNGEVARERFDEAIHYGEDYLFCVTLVLLHGSMFVFEDRLYHVVSREGSAVHSFNQKRFSEIAALQAIERKVQKYPKALRSVRYQIASRAFDILYLSTRNRGVLNDEQIRCLSTTMKEYAKYMLASKESIKRKIVFCKTLYSLGLRWR